MTRKDQIMALHEKGWSVRRITEKVYGLQPNLMSYAIDSKMAYVRVVIRQRRGTGVSPADRRYRDTENGSAKRSAQRQRWHERHTDYLAGYMNGYRAQTRQQGKAE